MLTVGGVLIVTGGLCNMVVTSWLMICVWVLVCCVLGEFRGL